MLCLDENNLYVLLSHPLNYSFYSFLLCYIDSYRRIWESTQKLILGTKNLNFVFTIFCKNHKKMKMIIIWKNFKNIINYREHSLASPLFTVFKSINIENHSFLRSHSIKKYSCFSLPCFSILVTFLCTKGKQLHFFLILSLSHRSSLLSSLFQLRQEVPLFSTCRSIEKNRTSLFVLSHWQ